MPRILRDSLRSFFSSSVSSRPSSTIEPASGTHVVGDGALVLHRRREVDRAAVVGELAGLVAGRLDLAGQLVDAGDAGAGDRLVGRGDQPDQAGRVVQRLEHRHRGHRRAVGVGDDALAGADRQSIASGLTSRDDQRDVGIHPPGRGVVDHGHAGRGEARAPARARWSRRRRRRRCRGRSGRRSRRPRR